MNSKGIHQCFLILVGNHLFTIRILIRVLLCGMWNCPDTIPGSPSSPAPTPGTQDTSSCAQALLVLVWTLHFLSSPLPPLAVLMCSHLLFNHGNI